MSHRNAPLREEGRRRLLERCQTRRIAHVAAEMGSHGSARASGSTVTASTARLAWRIVPASRTATSAQVVVRIETMRRVHKWSARRISIELAAEGVTVSVRTVRRHLAHLGLNRRWFLDPSGENNRQPQRIHARWPGHMVHLDVKRAGVIPDGGGWRAHGRGTEQAKQAVRGRKRGGGARYTYLHTTIDGFSRLADSEALPDEQTRTAIGFTHRARAFFATVLRGAGHQQAR